MPFIDGVKLVGGNAAIVLLIVVQSSLMGGTGRLYHAIVHRIVHGIEHGIDHRIVYGIVQIAISHPDDTLGGMVGAQIV